MESMKEKNKNMIKALGAGIVLGGAIAGGGVYASTVGASNVSYSNASSGLSATNAQGAIDALASQASELKYLKYYYACHSIRVSKDLYSQKYKDIKLVLSVDAYADMIYNLTSSTSTVSTYASKFSQSVHSCCKSSLYCNASSGTCYSKCTSGYDEYFVNC